MIRLLRALSWVVGWVTRSPRRFVGVLAVPVLIAIALLAGPIADRDPGRTPAGDVLAGGQTAAPPAATPSTPRSTVLPGTTGPAVPVPTRPTPTLAPAQAAAATGYVTVANTHDARPGGDRTFTDSYRRTRPYVTPELYAIVSADSRRGDYEWAQWLKEKATVTVQVVAVGVPDGAPAPTATTAYARVQFRQVITPTAGSGARTSDGAVNLLLSRTGDEWLVSRLLADT
jgi:hypothetical protein